MAGLLRKGVNPFPAVWQLKSVVPVVLNFHVTKSHGSTYRDGSIT